MLTAQLILLLERVRRRLTRSVLIAITLFSVAVVAVGGWLVYLAERAVNPDLATLGDAIWWAIVTVTTVGYGDRTPITLGGRAVGVCLMIIGIGFLGLFTATIASIFIDRLLRRGRGLTPVQAANHVLICGWSDKGQLIVRELRTETRQPVVILADLPEQPADGDGITFVRGRPYLEDSLRKADIAHAAVAVVLADAAEGDPSDARSVLTVLAIESINQEVHTCVEVLDRQNVEHMRRAGADEVLPTNELIGCLLARASLHPGVIDVVSDLSTADEGAEVYVLGVPQNMIGETFDSALNRLRQTHQAILIGIRVNGKPTICPDGSHTLKAGEQFVLVAKDRPAL